MPTDVLQRRGIRGLTLIEVVVAFVIASLAVVAVMRIFSTGLAGSRTSTDYLTAAMIAESKLAEVGILTPIKPGVAEGQYDERFVWALDIQTIEQAEEEPLMEAHAVTATVSWRDGTETRSFTLTSMRSHATQ